MGKQIARMLYGSQNYNLDTPESDKDYKVIEFPGAEDLFYVKTLNRQLSENESVWDVRNFLKYLMKANPNALELLFSVEQEYEDESFKELLDYIRPRIGSVIRLHWEEFGKATLGIAWESTRRNQVNPKTTARLTYFWLLWSSLVSEDDIHCGGTNGEMTELTWRHPLRTWPREIREMDPDDPKTQEELESQVAWIGHDWYPPNSTVELQVYDDEICYDIQQKILDYFKNHLTSC
jgi:hypothetical protein